MSTGTEQVAAELEATIGPPYPIRFPEDWSVSGRWQRAQTRGGQVGSIDPARFRVLLPDGADAHRVTFVIHQGELVHECDCRGWRYAPAAVPCAHVLHLWWRWCQGRAAVTDLGTEKTHLRPPWWLSVEGEA